MDTWSKGRGEQMESGGIYIFGAHSRAQTLAVYLKALVPGIFIEAFLYDDGQPNPKEVDGIPVVSLDSGGFYTGYPVYIGTRGVFHGEVTVRLREKGFKTIHPVTVGLDLMLRNRYLERYFASIQRDFIKIDGLTGMDGRKRPAVEQRSAAIYVATSIHDRPLTGRYEKRVYEKGIQVGAALTDERLPDCPVTDDTGETISARNGQFCELTALYWIWKNAGEEVVGLVHYRRHFILPDDWLERMLADKVDVILPVPLYVAPSLGENFRKRHDPSDWDYMLGYLKERDPQEYAEAEVFFGKNLYSPCNMFIMGRAVLDELCRWLFPILFAVAAHGGDKGDRYQD